MQPNIGDEGQRSTGPKEPMPTACKRPPECSFRNVTAEPIVASGDVVGNCVTVRSSGAVPTAQTNLVPPASIAPNTFRPLLYATESTGLNSAKINSIATNSPRGFFRNTVNGYYGPCGASMNSFSSEPNRPCVCRTLFAVLMLLAACWSQSAELAPIPRTSPSETVQGQFAAAQQAQKRGDYDTAEREYQAVLVEAPE